MKTKFSNFIGEDNSTRWVRTDHGYKYIGTIIKGPLQLVMRDVSKALTELRMMLSNKLLSISDYNRLKDLEDIDDEVDVYLFSQHMNWGGVFVNQQGALYHTHTEFPDATIYNISFAIMPSDIYFVVKKLTVEYSDDDEVLDIEDWYDGGEVDTDEDW